MPRQQRQIIPGHPNHIVHRGNNRRRLFSYRGDYRGFLRLVEDAYDEHDCDLSAACLLANHAHLLKTPPTKEAASACAGLYAQRYSQIRNLKRDASGKLFEQRYFSKPITSMLQLAFTTMYIDANPIRAGLVTDAIDYPWSTFGIHVGQPERSAIPVRMWTPNAWYLSLGKTAEERAATYRQMFAVYLAGGFAPDHQDELARYELLYKPYTRRLRRPNDSRAAEPRSRWPFARKR